MLRRLKPALPRLIECLGVALIAVAGAITLGIWVGLLVIGVYLVAIGYVEGA
jgi:hypothetical protein